MANDYNRNPKGTNQWVLRSNEEIQKIIDKHPTWTKKDFRGEGKIIFESHSPQVSAGNK